MTEDEFLALGRAGHNRVPLRLETLADLDTPLSIYLKLANRPNSYLLESVIGGATASSSRSATRTIPSITSTPTCAPSAPRRSGLRCVSRAGSPATSATTR